MQDARHSVPSTIPDEIARRSTDHLPVWQADFMALKGSRRRPDTGLLRPGQQPASDSTPAKSGTPKDNHFIASAPVLRAC